MQFQISPFHSFFSPIIQFHLSSNIELALLWFINKIKFQNPAVNIKFDTNLPEADYPFLGSSTTTLDHDKVLIDLTIVGETTHRGDCLFCEVILCGSIILHHLQVGAKC